jgi:hypothetical protein
MPAMLGFAVAIPCLASLAHDLPDTLLGTVGLLDLRAYEVALNSPTIWRTILWICYVASALGFLVLFPIAVRAAQGGRWRAAVPIGVLAFAVHRVFFLMFCR